MIHIAIGTKAQFIKMAPIMRRLQESSIAYNLIDLGQHSLITRDLREEFGLKDPDVVLSSGQNISRLIQGIKWSSGLFLKGLDKSWVKNKVFRGSSGICLIHGDTVSTILAMYLARRAGLLVAHVEAGLRSWDCLEPFPEELIRIITMRFSHILFAPSAWSFENLRKMGLAKRAVLLSGNTSQEASSYSLAKKAPLGLDTRDYALVTVHRMENIFDRKRLGSVVDLVLAVSKRMPVVFVQHAPTIQRLAAYGLDRRLKAAANIKFFPILTHAQFTSLIAGSALVITDGGSIQEECFYLDKPCLLLRRRTERMEGVGENVLVAGLDQSAAFDFLAHYREYVRKSALDEHACPSQEIVEYIKKWV